jgi:hypothetical protein
VLTREQSIIGVCGSEIVDHGAVARELKGMLASDPTVGPGDDDDTYVV